MSLEEKLELQEEAETRSKEKKRKERSKEENQRKLNLANKNNQASENIKEEEASNKIKLISKKDFRIQIRTLFPFEKEETGFGKGLMEMMRLKEPDFMRDFFNHLLSERRVSEIPNQVLNDKTRYFPIESSRMLT